MSKTCWMMVLVALCGCAGASASKKPAADKGGGSAGSAPAAVAPKKTLYERLGGQPAIEAVVTEFYALVAADKRVNAPFAVADLGALKVKLVDFVCMATGGPCKYTGRSMKASHQGMGVTHAQFDAVVEDLVKALDKFKVPEQEKNELLSALGPLRPEIVEVE